MYHTCYNCERCKQGFKYFESVHPIERIMSLCATHGYRFFCERQPKKVGDPSIFERDKWIVFVGNGKVLQAFTASALLDQLECHIKQKEKDV